MTALTHTPSHFMMPRHTAQWYRHQAEADFAGTLSTTDRALLESDQHIDAYRDAIKAWSAEVKDWLREYKAEQVKRKDAIAGWNDPPVELKRAYYAWEQEQQQMRAEMIRITDWCDKRLRQLRERQTEINVVARLRRDNDRLRAYIRSLLDEQLAAPADERDAEWIIELQNILLEEV